MSISSFVQQHLSEAQIASEQIGFPVSVILAQWGNETGWGTSSAWRDQHNYAGVSLGGQIMTFSDYVQGLAGYISRWHEPVYGPTRATVAALGGVKANPYDAAKAVEQSPWAAGHYGGNGLEAIIAQNNLQQYDTGRTDYPVPPGLAAAIAQHGNGNVGAGVIATLDAAHTGGCPEGNLVHIAMPGPIPNLNFTRCQGRALLGAVALVSGVGLMVVGLAFVAANTRSIQRAASVVGR